MFEVGDFPFGAGESDCGLCFLFVAFYRRDFFTQRGTASFSRHSPAGVVGSLRRGGGVELFETADLRSGGVHHGTRTF